MTPTQQPSNSEIQPLTDKIFLNNSFNPKIGIPTGIICIAGILFEIVSGLHQHQYLVLLFVLLLPTAFYILYNSLPHKTVIDPQKRTIIKHGGWPALIIGRQKYSLDNYKSVIVAKRDTNGTITYFVCLKPAKKDSKMLWLSYGNRSLELQEAIAQEIATKTKMSYAGVEDLPDASK